MSRSRHVSLVTRPPGRSVRAKAGHPASRDRLSPQRDSFSAYDGEKVAKPDEVRGVVSKDRLTKKRRSWNMSRIRGKHTTPERIVGSLLRRLGYRFRRHVRIPITTKPVGRKKAQGAQKVGRASPRAVSVDFLLPKHRVAIFVHGCFWHRHRGCKNCTTPMHPYACVGCVS